MSFDDLIGLRPYSLSQAGKEEHLLPALVGLTAHHARACGPFGRIVQASRPDFDKAKSLADLPFLPVSLFKRYDLKSIASSDVTSMLTSSGTTGDQVSHIAVDAITAERQALALASLVGHVLGPKPLPMLVLDCRAVVRDAARLSARGAGVLGMMRFGRHHAFAFDDEMNPDRQAIGAFLDRYGSGPFFMFGFTWVVWRYFVGALGNGTDLSNGVLLHSGGWKRMEAEAVDNRAFKAALVDRFGLARVHNFYGMVEQLGGIFLEGPDGWLHPPLFGDVIIRDVDTLSEAPVGQPGLIQVLSTVPLSYPGHSLLTEDIGVVHAVDGGEWGGKAFSVLGRAPRTVLRGCSDAVAFGGA